MCPSKRWLFRLAVLLLLAVTIPVLLMHVLQEDEVFEFGEREEDMLGTDIDGPALRHKPVFLPPENESEYPIIVWWTPFTALQRVINKCSGGTCLSTHSRTELENPETAAFMFYGSDLDWRDLPLPRKPHHLWALLHEESPKNNWVFATDAGISLFNITATCSRYSHYPLVTQFLHSLKKLNQPVRVPTSEKSKGDLGLVMYLHSDCDPPSDRDSYIEELMKYIKVDSYGRCLHNRDLPEHLLDTLTFNSDDIYSLQAKYKFTIAFENAICHDYITEKFWRPLYVGSVPVVRGSPTVQDWAPDIEHSIIVADKFASPKELAEYLLFLDGNDTEYEKYLEFKNTRVSNPRLLQHMEEREWIVDGRYEEYQEGKVNFIDGFQCFVCNEVHRRMKLAAEGKELPTVTANRDHYHCPLPEPSFKQSGKLSEGQGSKVS